MTVAELIEALQKLPDEAKNKQVWYPCIVVPNVEEEMTKVQEVTYERGSTVIQ